MSNPPCVRRSLFTAQQLPWSLQCFACTQQGHVCQLLTVLQEGTLLQQLGQVADRVVPPGDPLRSVLASPTAAAGAGPARQCAAGTEVADTAAAQPGVASTSQDSTRPSIEGAAAGLLKAADPPPPWVNAAQSAAVKTKQQAPAMRAPQQQLQATPPMRFAQSSAGGAPAQVAAALRPLPQPPQEQFQQQQLQRRPLEQHPSAPEAPGASPARAQRRNAHAAQSGLAQGDLPSLCRTVHALFRGTD